MFTKKLAEGGDPRQIAVTIYVPTQLVEFLLKWFIFILVGSPISLSIAFYINRQNVPTIQQNSQIERTLPGKL